MNRPHARAFRFSPWPIVMTLSAIGLAVGVFVVTQGVQQREARVASLNRQLLSEQQTLRVLDAEWAYLTRPQRLENLVSMKAGQAVVPPAPAPIQNTAPAASVAKVEPASGEVETPKAAEVKPVPAKKEIAQKTEPKKAEAKKAEPKKLAAAPVKKAKDDDLVWSIKRGAPKAPAASGVTPVAARHNTGPARVGIARPIVE